MVECNRCGTPVEASEVEGYAYYCPSCDEDMYGFECSPWEPEGLEELWSELSDVPIDEDECIESRWHIFPEGTHREAIWHWFDERYPKGVHALMFPGEGQMESTLPRGGMMHTYDGCTKVLARITSDDVDEYLESHGIEMPEKEFREFCDFVADALDWYFGEGKARELIDCYWHEYRRES